MNTVRFEEMAVKTYAGPERASGEYVKAEVARGLRDACKGLLGLMQLVAARNDISLDAQLALLENHRAVEARRVVNRLEVHTHVSSMDGTDTCKLCGMDIRDEIHARKALEEVK